MRISTPPQPAGGGPTDRRRSPPPAPPPQAPPKDNHHTKAPPLSSRFIEDGGGAAAPPQVRVSFAVLHQSGRAAELAPARFRKSLRAAFQLSEAELTLPRLSKVEVDRSLDEVARRSLWGGGDAPAALEVATYEFEVISSIPEVGRVGRMLDAATLETWV